MKFGTTEFGPYPLFLAPMEDVTDPSFRLICKELGADMLYTEFVNSDAMIRNVPRSLEKMNIYPEERPAGIQIYGHHIESMVEAARMAEQRQPEVIDINFGCPVRKIANRGAGAGMLDDVPRMVEMTRQIVGAVDLPVSVKTRLGTDPGNKNILEIALRLQDAGIAALTIHGRTRSQLYRGEADWTLIGEVKKHPDIHIPVIGNGDIDSGPKAREHFERYGVDAIMIGRAAIGRPWIFRDAAHYIRTGEERSPPLVKERVAIALNHFEKSLHFKGQPKGVYDMRRHFSNYFKALPDFREIRLRLLTTLDPVEAKDILWEIEERYTAVGY